MSRKLEDFVENNYLLNNDCLSVIFKHLPVKDVIVLSEVSQQFNEVAKETIKFHHPYIKLKTYFPLISVTTFENFMSSFANDLKGLSIDSVNLSNQYREWKYLKIIIEHFSKECRIKALEFENCCELSIPVFNMMTPIFNKLEKINFIRSCIPMTIPFFLQKWPEIKEVNFSYCRQADDKARQIECFPLTFRSNLKKLKLIRNSYLNILPLIPEFPEIFTQLEELKFYISLYSEPLPYHLRFIELMECVTSMSTLKILKMDFEFKEMFPILESIAHNLQNLHTLEISNGLYQNKCLETFRKLESLKSLHLYSIPNLKKYHLKPIVQRLPNLETLLINCRVNKRTLMEIMEYSPKLRKLEVEMHSRYALTKLNIEKLTEIAKVQKRQEAFHMHIYNFNSTPVGDKESQVLAENHNNPYLCITRWP